jgi:hypothetical protein
MENANIKKFVEEYQNCPFCNHILLIEARQNGDWEDEPNKFSVYMNGDRLDLCVKSLYFVDPKKTTFSFSILIKNGDILHCAGTDQFMSLYDMDIELYKNCTNCKNNSFYREVSLFYDRSIGGFSSNPKFENFSFAHEENIYTFSNNYSPPISELFVKNTKTKNFRGIRAPFIPFDKFQFNDIRKLTAKLNSIMVLI